MGLRVTTPKLEKYARSEGYHDGDDLIEDYLWRDEQETLLTTDARIVTAIPELQNKIWSENFGAKRINGHPPEYYARTLGVTVDELFPEDGLSLNVGDPWQKIDRKGVVIIDYEFGEVAGYELF